MRSHIFNAASDVGRGKQKQKLPPPQAFSLFAFLSFLATVYPEVSLSWLPTFIGKLAKSPARSGGLFAFVKRCLLMKLSNKFHEVAYFQCYLLYRSRQTKAKITPPLKRSPFLLFYPF
jgi:hypothetical protein